MDPWRFSVTLLGHTLFSVDLGAPAVPTPAVEPAPVDTAAKTDQPAGEAPGPVTERIAAPITQIGFQRRSRWADGRDMW